MHSIETAMRDVQKRIKQHQRGIVCRAGMWEGILAAVILDTAHEVLNALRQEEQAYLRGLYAEWPPSLWAQPEEVHQLCAEVESWCRATAGQ